MPVLAGSVGDRLERRQAIRAAAVAALAIARSPAGVADLVTCQQLVPVADRLAGLGRLPHLSHSDHRVNARRRGIRGDAAAHGKNHPAAGRAAVETGLRKLGHYLRRLTHGDMQRWHIAHQRDSVTHRRLGLRDVHFVGEVEDVEACLGQRGIEVWARGVVVVDAHQPVELGEDALQVRRDELVVVINRHHADNVVQQQDAFRVGQHVELGVQPVDEGGGDLLQTALDDSWLLHQTGHQAGQPHDPAGGHHWSARRHHVDPQSLGV